MKFGFILGCLLSILLWKFDRQKIFFRFNSILSKKIESKKILEIIYLILICLIGIIMAAASQFKNNYSEIYNGITAFLIIDISNTERKSVKYKERANFYNSISIISRSMVCGFIAPILYTILFGNIFGIIYMLIYNFSLIGDFNVINFLFSFLTIIPSLISQFFLYIIYLSKFRSFAVDFEGDYLSNFFTKPLLNVDIMAAYVEHINFYYYGKGNFIRSYGKYNNSKISESLIRNYVGISYTICMIFFILIYLYKILVYYM